MVEAFVYGADVEPDERKVSAGGFTVWTSDPVMIAMAAQCNRLAAENAKLCRELVQARHRETALFRTLRRDVKAVRGAIRRMEKANG
jgi:hypothetical protein